MQVKVLDYNFLSETERKMLDQLTLGHALHEQLWFISLLSNNSVKIFIYGEYDTVLFLPYRSKFAFKYAYMPVLLQKLSFFGHNSGIEPIIKKVLQTIRFGEISIINTPFVERFDLTKVRKNYKLDLQNSYSDLRSNFSNNHKRNILKTEHIEIQESQSLDALISIFNLEKSNLFGQKRIKQLENGLYKIANCFELNNKTLIINAYDSNHLIASAFFIHYNAAIYYVLGSSYKNDKKLSSLGLFRIFDYVIKSYSDTNTILDFEGSEIPGIARFFKGFGAIQEEYNFVRWNRLPFPINKLKK